MLIKNSSEESSCTVGTQHARHLSDRHRTRKTVPFLVQLSVILTPRGYHCAVTVSRQSFPVRSDSVTLVARKGAVLLVEESAICCSVFVPVVVITVRALYAGTLVTYWTTALCPRCRCSSALLALCLILATLTITSRCYTLSNGRHPLVQFSPNVDSNASSSIVLSRLFKSPRKFVQSDTRIIVTNSKILLFNQKIFNRRNFNAHFRTKRELQTNPVVLNEFQSYQTKTYSEGNSSLYRIQEDTQLRTNAISTYPLTTNNNPTELNKHPSFKVRTAELQANHESQVDKRSDFVANGTSSGDSAWNNSVGANFSEVSTTLRVVDRQSDQEDKQRPLPESRVPQPMPPAHGHDNNSCKF